MSSARSAVNRAAAALCVALCLVLVAGLLSVLWGSTPEPPAKPSGYVEDLADALTPETRRQLGGYLLELEQKTTAQIMILTVRSLDGEDIAGFALRVAEKWKPGQKGKDNGVLIAVAIADKKYRIEVGYGLESVLPDSLVGSIGREHLVPYFRKGDYGAGLVSATSVIAHTIASGQGVELSGLPRPQSPSPVKPKETLSPALFYVLLFLALGVVPFLWNLFQSRQRAAARGRPSGGSGVWWGGGGISSGSGGFDGGGFSGGGGGSFGGGGASGDW